MKLVVDTNRLMAGMLKTSLCREIIMHEALEFFAPDYLVTEIGKHRLYICEKAGLEEKNFNVLLYILLERVNLVPYEEFAHCIGDAIGIMNRVDVKDAPFIAVGIALNLEGIWTEDRHFYDQTAIRVYSTRELEKFLWGRKSEG